MGGLRQAVSMTPMGFFIFQLRRNYRKRWTSIMPVMTR
jgi:hypothetical protein